MKQIDTPVSPISIAKGVILLVIGVIFITIFIYSSSPRFLGGTASEPRPVRGVIVESLVDGHNELNDSDELLIDASVYGDKLEPPSTQNNETTFASCPQYLLPVLPGLPELPPKEVLDAITRDQLNFVLYQHIKEHQSRTIEVRRRIFKSYGAYLKECE